jgi:hypothetical protein
MPDALSPRCKPGSPRGHRRWSRAFGDHAAGRPGWYRAPRRCRRRPPDVDEEIRLPDPQLAYIDPGSGSLIIQVLVAMLVAIPIFFRRQIARLANIARGRRPDPDASDTKHDRT